MKCEGYLTIRALNLINSKSDASGRTTHNSISNSVILYITTLYLKPEFNALKYQQLINVEQLPLNYLLELQFQ